MLPFLFYSKFELFNNINKVDPSFTQLDTKEQINILSYGYLPNKSNALNQDIINFAINFLKTSGGFDEPLISLNQCLMYCYFAFSFLPVYLLYAGFFLVTFFY